MDKNTRNALIKRECGLAQGLMMQVSMEKATNARNKIKQQFDSSELLIDFAQIVDNFNERDIDERTFGDRFEDMFHTHMLLMDKLNDIEEELRNVVDIIFDEYEKQMDMGDADLAIDILFARLDGIATPRQIRREFTKMTEQVDEAVFEAICGYGEDIVQTFNIKLNEIAGGFSYELDMVMDLIVKNMDFTDNDSKKISKITDRKELEQLAMDNGFEFKRQTGSHRIYENENGQVTVIPFHGKDINVGLAYEIQKQILK